MENAARTRAARRPVNAAITTMDEPTFGIVLPTYNRPDSLLVATNSVLAQRYPHWKLAIVDDSTNDATQRWADNYVFDERITYTKNDRNRGVGYSRNVALDQLVDTVDFIVFLDDDDYFDDACLLNASRFIQANNGYHWYLSRRISTRTGESITAVNEKKDNYSYVDDMLFGNAIKRDATHFISTHAIRDKQARFDERFRSGGEWRFYVQLERNYAIKFFEGGTSYGDHLAGGLSDRNRKNIQYKLNEQYDLFKFLEAENRLPQEQARQLHKVIKFAYRNRARTIFDELNQRQLNALPLLDSLAIRFKLFVYGKLCGIGKH